MYVSILQKKSHNGADSIFSVEKSRGRKRVTDKRQSTEETKEVKLILTKEVIPKTKQKTASESSIRNIATKRKKSTHDVGPPRKINKHESKSATVTADTTTMKTNLTDKPLRRKRIKFTEQVSTQSL